MNTFYASFYGNSIFSIFFNDLKVLKSILKKLEENYNESEEPVQKDIGVDLKCPELRRIYKVLSVHELNGQRVSEKNDKMIKCNSLIYKCLHSSEG